MIAVTPESLILPPCRTHVCFMSTKSDFSTPQVESSEAVVQRQLDAYNARDLEALLGVYADDAQLFEFPGTLLAHGSNQLRERFGLRFKEPNLHARLLQRIVMGRTVVDHERITRTFPEGTGTLEMTMIYEVAGGRIQRAWAIPGARSVDPARE